ncbi:MAG: biotin--[acetyl-CoA-carboxylase] ligase, partial [Thermoproteota archaeon]|nr:biotin--[acetyl-CoA-carboxylase] ligase [Thermoproteota archaeon]
KIRALGYKIESKQNIGYRLVDSSKLPLPWEIKEDLNTKFLGNRIYYFDTIDTTQNFAMKIASEKNEDGSVVISKKQTGGRGRMKRKWKSPVGGIWMSIIINPKFDVTYTTLVPIATSLALCIAIEKILKINTKLKWPNDITLKKKKVAGVLINVSMTSNQIENMVLGIGINFKINPNELENSIKKTPNFYGVGTLVKKNQSMTPLIKQFLYELENVLQLINSGQIKKIRNGWTKRSSTIGRNVSIVTNEGRISGKAIRIDNEGGLIISKNKKTHRVIVGDVKE